MTLVAYDTVPSPLEYPYVSPEILEIQAVSLPTTGISSFMALNLSSILSSSACFA
jgi:hypothetical protein